MRLIDADKFLSIMKVLNCNLLRLKDIENYIEIYGTVDPESLRPKARWLKISVPFNTGNECSNCGWGYSDSKGFPDFKFCPNCGAKMDLEEKN